ncbi:barstar family protein [Streptomyces phaeofaciens]|nr:barstar family protein [Streptomyces phaeofaciens]
MTTEKGPAVRIHPWLHVVPDGSDGSGVPLGELLPVPGRTYVARVDGREMADVDGVFQQFWDGLRLPDYFGWNWDAFSDCLRDLGWLEADHHVLVVEHAQAVLADDAEEREQFWGIVLQAGRRWSYTKRPEAVELGRLVVVASCDTGSAESLTGLLKTL